MTVQMLFLYCRDGGHTYLIRALPMLLVRKKIKNRFVQSFLYYVPYAVLAAMTVPAILESTASAVSAMAGLLVAVLLSYLGRRASARGAGGLRGGVLRRMAAGHLAVSCPAAQACPYCWGAALCP